MIDINQRFSNLEATMRTKYVVILLTLVTVVLVISGSSAGPFSSPSRAHELQVSASVPSPRPSSNGRQMQLPGALPLALAGSIPTGPPVAAASSAIHHGTMGPNPNPTHSLPLVVDGAKTPEKVPDYLAYRHFIMVTAEAANASAHELNRRNAALAELNLSGADYTVYIRAMDGVREQLNEISQQSMRRSLTAEVSLADRIRLKQAEDGILDGAARRARETLSAEGAARLDMHIRERIKRHIVIYGEVVPAAQ